MTAGRLAIEWEDDVEILSSGDIFHCPAGPPGHRLEAADPATFVDLTPIAALAGGARWRNGVAEANSHRPRPSRGHRGGCARSERIPLSSRRCRGPPRHRGAIARTRRRASSSGVSIAAGSWATGVSRAWSRLSTISIEARWGPRGRRRPGRRPPRRRAGSAGPAAARCPIVLRMTSGHEDAALDELDDDVDAGHDDARAPATRWPRRGPPGSAPSSGPTIGIASAIAAISPSRSAPGRPSSGVGDAGRDAHRAHQDQLAADPQPEPRLDLVPGIARAGAPVAPGGRPARSAAAGRARPARRRRSSGASRARPPPRPPSAPTSTTWSGSGVRRLGDGRSSTESTSAVTDRDRVAGRRVAAQARTESKNGGQAGDDLLALADRRRHDDEGEPERRSTKKAA